MKVELTPDAAHWVEAEIAAGTFPTAEDAVRFAVQQAKIAALRAKLDAAVAEGGSHSADDVVAYVEQHLDRLDQLGTGTKSKVIQCLAWSSSPAPDANWRKSLLTSNARTVIAMQRGSSSQRSWPIASASRNCPQ